MARIRSIHPGIFTDEAFMTASAHARILIMGLWCEAHDDGVFEWKALTLKVRLMPADNVDVAALLCELERLRFIRRFAANGRTYGVIRNFQKYQRPKKPNSSKVLPDELLPYARGDGPGPEPEEEEFRTGGEPVPLGEEDGGEGGEEEVARERAGEAAARGSRSGSDELGPWLRSLVGQEPVLLDTDIGPIERLLAEGLTRPDVEAGIGEAMAAPDFRPRTWRQLAGWIRTAAKNRLGANPKLRVVTRTAAPPPREATPEQIRTQQRFLAVRHFRDEWSDSWPNACRPGHPDCTTPEDIIEDARLEVELSRTVPPEVLARARAVVH